MCAFGPKPVEEGNGYTVTIDAQGARGDGIAHMDGFVIFVTNAKVGETVKIRVTSVRNKFAIGEKI